MNPRERVLAALEHRQPDKVPWHCEFTDTALTRLAHYCGDRRLTEDAFFSEWVGNHFRFVGPRGGGQFRGLEMVAMIEAVREQWLRDRRERNTWL